MTMPKNDTRCPQGARIGAQPTPQAPTVERTLDAIFEAVETLAQRKSRPQVRAHLEALVAPLEAENKRQRECLERTSAALAEAIPAVEALEAENARLDRWLQSLTPGGSEFVKNPERCVAWAEDRWRSLLHSNVQYVKERKAVEAENTRLRMALAEMREWAVRVAADTTSVPTPPEWGPEK